MSVLQHLLPSIQKCHLCTSTVLQAPHLLQLAGYSCNAPQQPQHKLTLWGRQTPRVRFSLGRKDAPGDRSTANLLSPRKATGHSFCCVRSVPTGQAFCVRAYGRAEVKLGDMKLSHLQSLSNSIMSCPGGSPQHLRSAKPPLSAPIFPLLQ